MQLFTLSPSTSFPEAGGLFSSFATASSGEVMKPPADRLINLVSEYLPVVESVPFLSEEARHAARMMTMCHTSALGGHAEECPDGHIRRIFYNSCGHRFCPRCAAGIRRKWLIAREAKLFPVRHYHTIFTLPHTFNALWRYNHRKMGDLLFHSGVNALKVLLADSRRPGAETGITAALETWDDRMLFHPHLHCMVTGGGLSPEGKWIDAANPDCLVAVKPLMYEFRKQFCQGLRQLLKDDELTLPENAAKRRWFARLNKINRKNWAVFIAKQPENGGPTTEDILRYLSRDVAGGPLSGDRLVPRSSELSAAQLAYLNSKPLTEARLREAREGEVGFTWGKYDPITQKRERTEIETLPIEDFLQRYLQHVSPSGYQAIRHYGLYTSAKKAAYEQCAELLLDRSPPVSSDETGEEPSFDNDSLVAEHTCPVCGRPLIVTGYLPSTLTGLIVERPPLGPVSVQFPVSGAVYAS
jgi:hypothetical protein